MIGALETITAIETLATGRQAISTELTLAGGSELIVNGSLYLI